MKRCLMVMHVRDFADCLGSYERLPIDRAYFTGYTERGLEKEMARFVGETDYDDYLIVQDDVVATREAFGLIAKGLDAKEVMTGYCTVPNDRDTLFLCDWPLEDCPPKGLKSYPFMPRRVAEGCADYIPTTFVNFVMTGMRRGLWLKYPFKPFYSGNPLVGWTKVGLNKLGLRHSTPSWNGWASDYSLSWRLQRDGVKMWAAKGAEMTHYGGSAWGRNFPLNIGKVEPSVEVRRA